MILLNNLVYIGNIVAKIQQNLDYKTVDTWPNVRYNKHIDSNKLELEMQLNTGDNVQWTSSAGVKQGVIKKFYLDLAADDKMHPWICIEFNITKDASVKATATFEASHSNLLCMQVSKI